MLSSPRVACSPLAELDEALSSSIAVGVIVGALERKGAAAREAQPAAEGYPTDRSRVSPSYCPERECWVFGAVEQAGNCLCAPIGDDERWTLRDLFGLLLSRDKLAGLSQVRSVQEKGRESGGREEIHVILWRRLIGILHAHTSLTLHSACSISKTVVSGYGTREMLLRAQHYDAMTAIRKRASELGESLTSLTKLTRDTTRHAKSSQRLMGYSS